jgi:hypothetical protein
MSALCLRYEATGVQSVGKALGWTRPLRHSRLEAQP